jgi:hypothetical protein
MNNEQILNKLETEKNLILEFKPFEKSFIEKDNQKIKDKRKFKRFNYCLYSERSAN